MAVNNPQYIIIHCTDVSYRTLWNQLNSVNKYHRSQEFPASSLGYHVGYHVLITGGQSFKCRDDGDEGAHCNQQVGGLSMNYQSLGVCVGFDGDIETMPEDWRLMLQRQVWSWQDKFGITDKNVRFHREFSLGKTCPGGLLGENWKKDLLKRPEVKPIDQHVKREEILSQISFWTSILERLRRKNVGF